ncbi:MAG: MmcQ/YjbR family DNA-binding protein [Blastocatellia bacterium]
MRNTKKTTRKTDAGNNAPPPVTWETVRDIAAALSGAVEGTSYGTPAFFVRKKLFARFHQSGECVVILVPIAEREALMQADSGTLYITDHYLNYPYMLVRLATVRQEDLRGLIEESWRRAGGAKE